jgi:tyrosinase
VSKLPSSDRTLEFYEKAIAQMQKLGLDKPVSWRYQGAIHDYPQRAGRIDQTPFPGRTDDPNQRPGDIFPGDANKFWAKCEHGAWFFLSWHRIYLHFFEKIIMKTIRDNFTDGPKDWALPYWDVTNHPILPAPFRIPNDPDKNHLFVKQRSDRVNNGLPFLDIERAPPFRPIPGNPDTNLNCLKSTSFIGVFPAAFGGPIGPDGPDGHSHIPANSGSLEMIPHNVVHNQFGNDSFMIDPEKAALDPIFWLHHCNIDRLWEVWVQRQKQLKRLQRNPKDSDPGQDSKKWLGVSFDFHDENGVETPMNSRDCLDTRQPPLSYEYEDISDPFKGAP